MMVRDDWECRRRSRARWLRVLLALLFAIVAAGGVLIAGWAAGGRFDSVFGMWGIKDALDWMQQVLDARASFLGIRSIPDGAKFFVMLIPFCITSYGLNGNRALRLHDRLFPLYDGSHFLPIRPPDAGIAGLAPLPWAEDTKLDTILDSLRASLDDPKNRGTDAVPWRRPFSPIRPPLAFDHLLLLGRPGAGKSRMARELARRLGRREILGNGGSGNPAHPIAARVLIRRDRSRRFWWFLDRRAGDPWDSGQIVGPVPDAFAQWRPARPTLLWIDDPVPDDAVQWVTKLREHASGYRFAVRLVIANQAELGDLPASARHPEPIILRQETYFTARDILHLAKAANLNPFDLARAGVVHDVTDGNPLLVELAFDFLRLDRPLAEMTREKIVGERVERIVTTLERAGEGFRSVDAKKAIALATLIGPGCPLSAANAVFPTAGLHRTMLEKAFVSERTQGLDLSETLPMIRPEMIGDAFVRRIAREQADAAAQIAAAGFAIDPERWLIALARLGRGDDRVADAMCALPGGLAGMSAGFRIRHAQALIGLALHDWREPEEIADTVDRLLATFDLPARRETAAGLLEWHDALVADDDRARHDSGARWAADLASGMTPAEAFAAQERDSLQPGAHRFIHGRGIALIAPMLAANRFAEPAPPAWDVASVTARLAFLSSWMRQFDVRTTSFSSATASARWTVPLFDRGSVRRRERSAVVQHLRGWRLEGSSTEILVAAISAVAWLARLIPSDSGKCFARCQEAWLAHDHASKCQTAVASLEEIAGQPRYADDRDVQLDRARARRTLTYVLAGDPTACRTAVASVEEIAGQPGYAEDLEMQYQRALAWRSLVYALKDDPARCRIAVASLEEIAGRQRYADDREMQHGCAQARSHLAYALREDSASCRTAAASVEAIAGQPRYADDRDMQCELVHARRCLAFALRGDSTGCQIAVASVEGIAGQPRYADDHEMQSERSQALRILAYALEGDPAGCRRAVDSVEKIAGQPRYANDREMQRDRAHAWRCLAFAFEHDPAGCRIAVASVEEIAGQPRYADDRDMQYERAKAQRCLAFALREDSSACRTAAASVEEIAGQARYADDRDMQHERAQARRFLAFARRHDPAGFIAEIRTLEAIVATADPAWPEYDKIVEELRQAQTYRA